METISTTISEKDIAECKSYFDNDNCLIATSFRNNGITAHVRGSSVIINDQCFSFKDTDLEYDLADKELYPRAFLGKTFEFVKNGQH